MTEAGLTLYDTTLRDGTQGEEIAFSVEDKLKIAEKIDALGVHYIEAGWPGSNPKDLEFFKHASKLKLKHAKISAFGSTRKAGTSADQDPNLKALLEAETPVITIFGKSWDFHVSEALKISLPENLELISDSIQYLKKHCDEVIYDAEHFFDGYKANPEYALKTLKYAEQAGAGWIVLCDTNGGSLPGEIHQITQTVGQFLKTKIGIHCHNDGELAVANSLAAISAGALQVHGTVNGFGERCGNANLISVIPNLKLKLGKNVVSAAQLKHLKEVAYFVDEMTGRSPNTHQPFVGRSAFAHKGGIHVNAVAKNPKTYEHIDPVAVGNERRILVSDLSGGSNILMKAAEFGLELGSHDPAVKKILEEVKALENEGFQFEGAEASFELLMKKALKTHKTFFNLIGFRVIDEKFSAEGEPRSEATLQLEVNGQQEHMAATGHGPVNALDKALRRGLEKFYPQLKEVKLIDYQVRVLPSKESTASRVRVLIESTDFQETWKTVGVSTNIIQASWMALVDSIEYKLLKNL